MKNNVDINSDGRKTILVVEDNEFVRTMTTNILQMNGYSVVDAIHGKDAYTICTNKTEPIDLILTDVLMPYMTGPELIERLRDVRNDFKVLYMSGFMDDASLQRLTSASEEINFIGKPFSVPDLLKKVEDVLMIGTAGRNAASGG